MTILFAEMQPKPEKKNCAKYLRIQRKNYHSRPTLKCKFLLLPGEYVNVLRISNHDNNNKD